MPRSFQHRCVGLFHEDAERFIEEVHGDDPELASYLRIEEREAGADGAIEPLSLD